MLEVRLRVFQLSLGCLCIIGTLVVSCKKDAPTQPPELPPAHASLTLQATFVSVRWCRLQWQNGPVASSFQYVLLRNNRDTVFAGTLPHEDSVHVLQDSLLTPGTAYAYTLYRILKGSHWDSASVTVATLAITPSDITFKGYGFGEPGSYLRGIWASSPTDVWACGLIDSTNGPPFHAYSAVHYDGQSFRLYRLLGTLEGVFGVDSSDVWFCGSDGGTLVCHYAKGDWTTYNISGDTTVLGYPIAFTLTGIWASPDKKWVYAVGNGGTILRLNRQTDKWEQMASPTNYDLRNIKMIGDTLYACGIGPQHGYGVIIRFDGTAWSTFVQSTPAAPYDSSKIQGDIMGIGGVAPDSMYFTGAQIYKRNGQGWKGVTPSRKDVGDVQYMVDLFVENWNRVLVCGDNDMILLWNGERWYSLSGVGVDRYERVFALNSSVFLVGWSTYTAVLGISK